MSLRVYALTFLRYTYPSGEVRSLLFDGSVPLRNFHSVLRAFFFYPANGTTYVSDGGSLFRLGRVSQRGSLLFLKGFAAVCKGNQNAAELAHKLQHRVYAFLT